MANLQRQPVATNALIESSNGKTFRPLVSTNQLAPSWGSVVSNPPDCVRLVGVDYQTVTNPNVTLVAGSIGLYSFIPVGFPGLFSAAQKLYSTQGSLPAPPMQLNPTNLNSSTGLNTGQSTQLLLICFAQLVPNGTTTIVGYPNITTQAFQVGIDAPITGPLFPSGVRYLAFSATASIAVYSAVNALLAVTLGLTAQLYAIFNQ